MPSMVTLQSVRSLRHQRSGSPGRRWRQAALYHALRFAKHAPSSNERPCRLTHRYHAHTRWLETDTEAARWVHDGQGPSGFSTKSDRRSIFPAGHAGFR